MLILTLILTLIPCTVHAQSSSKIGPELQEVLNRLDPTERVNIIIVFQDRPSDNQIDILKSIHKMEVTHVYTIIDGVAGSVNAGEVPKIADYDWVKEIWLDKKVYGTSSSAVEMSKMLELIQRENEALKKEVSSLEQEISDLKEKIQSQQSQISQLDMNLKLYSFLYERYLNGVWFRSSCFVLYSISIFLMLSSDNQGIVG